MGAGAPRGQVEWMLRVRGIRLRGPMLQQVPGDGGDNKGGKDEESDLGAVRACDADGHAREDAGIDMDRRPHQCGKHVGDEEVAR